MFMIDCATSTKIFVGSLPRRIEDLLTRSIFRKKRFRDKIIREEPALLHAEGNIFDGPRVRINDDEALYSDDFLQEEALV